MSSASHQLAPGPARRAVVAAAGAAGLSVALTACGGSDESSGTSDPAAPGDGSDSGEGTGGGSADEAAGVTLASVADIPEGGGKVFADREVVVTQPTAGEFKAFSAACTHQGCAVQSVVDGVINCPCHNSNFSIADGSVQSGPATKPLPAMEITVSGDSITLS